MKTTNAQVVIRTNKTTHMNSDSDAVDKNNTQELCDEDKLTYRLCELLKGDDIIMRTSYVYNCNVLFTDNRKCHYELETKTIYKNINSVTDDDEDDEDDDEDDEYETFKTTHMNRRNNEQFAGSFKRYLKLTIKTYNFLSLLKGFSHTKALPTAEITTKMDKFSLPRSNNTHHSTPNDDLVTRLLPKIQETPIQNS